MSAHESHNFLDTGIYATNQPTKTLHLCSCGMSCWLEKEKTDGWMSDEEPYSFGPSLKYGDVVSVAGESYKISALNEDFSTQYQRTSINFVLIKEKTDE